MSRHLIASNKLPSYIVASYPGLLTPAFVACSTNAGVRMPGYEATYIVHIALTSHIQLQHQVKWTS